MQRNERPEPVSFVRGKEGSERNIAGLLVPLLTFKLYIAIAMKSTISWKSIKIIFIVLSGYITDNWSQAQEDVQQALPTLPSRH